MTLIIRGRNLSIKQAAEIVGKSQQFVRLGLQRKEFPFGTAVKLSTKWTYYISPARFYEYVGIEERETSVRKKEKTETAIEEA